MSPTAFIRFWPVDLDPPPDTTGADGQTSFRSHLRHLCRRNRVPEIPTHTPHSDVARIWSPLERIGSGDRHISTYQTDPANFRNEIVRREVCSASPHNFRPVVSQIASVRFSQRNRRRQPRVIITDKLRSYAAAKRVVMPGVAHRQHRYLNNRAENSHQPTRERERRMRRFKSARHAQHFVEVHGTISSHFRLRRHLLSAAYYSRLRSKRFRIWNEITGAAALA